MSEKLVHPEFVIGPVQVTNESASQSQSGTDTPKQVACVAEVDAKKRPTGVVDGETINNDKFEQFVKFFRQHSTNGGFAAYNLNDHHRAWTEIDHERARLQHDLRTRVENTRYLWSRSEQDESANVEASEHEDEESKLNLFEWQQNLRRRGSCTAGVEGWVSKLEVPDVPDNRVKIIFRSVSAEMRKSELRNQLRGSVLKTDHVLCSLFMQMQIHEWLERIRLVKYSVETLEDVLSLLSDSSLDSKHLNCLMRQLTATIHRDSLKELLEIAHARQLVLVSVGVLLANSDFKSHAFEVFRLLVFDAVHGEAVSNRLSMLTDVIERCHAEELLWLAQNILTLYAEDEQLQKSSTGAAVVESLRKKAADLNCGSQPGWKKVLQTLGKAEAHH